jgi:hypothetical protein
MVIQISNIAVHAIPISMSYAQDEHWVMKTDPSTVSLVNYMYSTFQIYLGQLREKRAEDNRIAEMRHTIASLPYIDIDRAKTMRSLALALRARFLNRGSTCLRDLEEATTLDYQLLLRIPKDDPMRPLFLELIGHSLFVRFEHLHKIEDLDKCIKFYQHALALPQCTERSQCENYLAKAVKQKKEHAVTKQIDVVKT